MIKFKYPFVRIRCLECREEHFIEMKHLGTEKEQQSISFECQHIYRGKLKCSHCSEEMKLLITLFEYPKGFLNYHETNNESCLVMDDITEDSLDFE